MTTATILVQNAQGQFELSVDEAAQMVVTMGQPLFLRVLRRAAIDGKMQIVRDLVDAIELEQGVSAFDTPANLQVFENMTKTINLCTWLRDTGQKPSRQGLLSFWEMFMVQSLAHGIRMGKISEATGGGLWKATPYLSTKMLEDPAAYGYLPASRANHPILVGQVLDRLNYPASWLEIVVGDALEQMVKSPAFLKAFSLNDSMEGIPGALYGVQVCLLG